MPPDQITPQLRALFDPRMPAGFRCFAVLDGTVVGRVIADDPLQPTWGAVQEGAFGTVYPGGALDQSTWSQLIAELQKYGDVLVGLWPDDQRVELLPPDPGYNGYTLDFSNRPTGVGLDRFLGQSPDGYKLRALDRQLFERSEDRDFYSALYGSAGQALEHLRGCFVTIGDEICSEAYAYFAALGTIEIATSTREPYRSRGYATLACAAIIRECEQQGYQTCWNCAKQNLASAALARKLGFRSEREYRLLAWLKPPPD
ncbi:MAG TPA: GNAT family N-acetyltransferase [Roseiflexaceae bacterium]|nr:GNAT family N-acetyltransferase [Roseiflexaceae bacterium]